MSYGMCDKRGEVKADENVLEVQNQWMLKDCSMQRVLLLTEVAGNCVGLRCPID